MSYNKVSYEFEERSNASKIHYEILSGMMNDITKIFKAETRVHIKLVNEQIEPYIIIDTADSKMEICFYHPVEEFETCYLADYCARKDAEDFDIRDPEFPGNLLQRIRDLNVKGRRALLNAVRDKSRTSVEE